MRARQSAVVAAGIPHAVDPQKIIRVSRRPLVGSVWRTLWAAPCHAVESGFEPDTPERRMSAVRGNSGGWEIKMQNIAKHVATS